MKAGILYPRSKEHPGMMADFVDGIKTVLQHLQLNEKIQLITESIGYGGNEKEVYEKAEKLLLLEGAEVLVAFVDLRVLEILKPLFFTSGKLVIVVNPGANYPQNWVPQSNILSLTLQHGFLCRLSGKLAAQMNKKNAAMATTFYDCGYLHTAAMVKGFVSEGGSIKFNHVNKHLYDDTFDIEPLTGHLSTEKGTDCLLCVYDSLPASFFYAKLNEYKEAFRLELFVSPMMLEKKALEKMGEGYKFSINGYLPWHSSIKNMANKNFLESYSQQTKKDATVFSLLGWEVGLIMQQVFLHSNENYADGEEIAGKMASVKINSPRGEMKLDQETNYFIAPVCKFSISKDQVKPVLDHIENPEKEWNDFVQAPATGISSGWTNTYLCY